MSAIPIASSRADASAFEPWRYPLALFGISFALFAAFSGQKLFHQSLAPQFVYQAEAFLHGRLDIATPPNLNDWARAGDRWYVSFPPFPAILMMPAALIAGYQLNDVFFTVVVAALNVALLFLVLEQLRRAGDSGRTRTQNAALALLFAFGTLDFYCSIRGEVWFTAEVVGVGLSCAYLLAAHRGRHPALAGLALGCAAITRTPLAFALPYFVLEVLSPEGGWPSAAELRRRQREIWTKALLFGAPIAAIALPMMWMNEARFGSPTDFGHGHLFDNRVNADIAHWGLFHYHYLERNLHAAFTRLPGLEWPPGGLPRLSFDGNGMSLFVTTPLFFLLLWPKERPRLHLPLWLTVAAVSVPGFFYQNTGWRQFGFRFSLDYTPYLFLLLAIGARKMGKGFWTLGLMGVLVNLWGALAF
ncbi:MAG: hypothetical protein ACYCWW_16960 [Deltaproteobacteria bacterium]